MLRNRLRRFIGLLIFLVMGIAIIQYFRQTSGNQYVVGALFDGLKFFVFLVVVLWLVYRFDRRVKKREE